MNEGTYNSPLAARALEGEINHRSTLAKSMVFADPASQELLKLLDRIAPRDVPIMISGETGTGKELVARHVHRASGRIGPFLAVNCGAIAEELAESELFGHEAGSFTGAKTRREGWFEAANLGTLFLDEIGDLPMSLQGKLLRVLQEHEVVRIGSRKTTPIDVRLISATNVDLSDAVSKGQFRLDLFYRLNIAQVQLPPLRERPGDIEALANHFLLAHSKRLHLPLPALSAKAIESLRRYSWPGNIRELENVIHFAILVASDSEITPEHLRFSGNLEVLNNGQSPAQARKEKPPLEQLTDALQALFAAPGDSLFDDVERRIVEESFRYCDMNQVRTASLLGISRNVVRTLLKRHGFLDASNDNQSAVND